MAQICQRKTHSINNLGHTLHKHKDFVHQEFKNVGYGIYKKKKFNFFYCSIKEGIMATDP